MNENLNLVEILKDCPKGTKLYSTLFGEVEFEEITKNITLPIAVRTNDGLIDDKIESFSADGKIYSYYDGECVLFPSKDQRDWSKFNPCEFKDGDILSYKCGCLKNRSIYIYRYHKTLNTAYYVALSGDTDSTFRINSKGECALNGYDHTVRFATEEEKQKLFDAIKENGYKWNAKTKTLDKLVESKFDPKTLQPFDKVLVRDSNSERWRCGLFSYIINENIPPTYQCIGCWYRFCIPYNNDTKHLVGTTDEAPEFYRYWED